MLKKTAAASAFLFVLLLLSIKSLAFTTFYESTNKENISKGVTYEESTRITDMGLLDVFILKLPTDDPNLILTAVASGNEIGLKETTSKLLSDSGAIAGVNGDYFGTAGTYSMPLGLQVDTGGVLSVSSNSNTGSSKYSSFMLASDGNYFMDYVNVGIRFLNNGVENIQIGSLNKVADLAGPAVITSDFMTDTSGIDARIENAVKVVVQNDYITYVSGKGETVSVPPNGYIVLMSAAAADQCIWSFQAGQRADLIMDASLNIWGIEAAISGGGKLLLNGEVVTSGSQYISGTNPRTAVGLSADMKEIIIMVVDGRSHSVGVTHEEMAQLMFQAGAYNAMHLDGGGSTEMVVKKAGAEKLEIVNYPSGGFERKVINALGIYVGAAYGSIESLVIHCYSDTVVVSSPVKVEVYGLDAYMRRVDIPMNLISLSSSGQSTFFDGYFNAFETGEFTLTASYGGYTAVCAVNATELYELRPNIKEIYTTVGGKWTLTYTGIGKNGNVFEIDPLAVGIEVYPSNLGEANYSEFMTTAAGIGWIRCHIGKVSTYIPVYSTILAQKIDDLNGGKALSFTAYPDTVSGYAYYEKLPNYFLPVVKLAYYFNEADYTQAAYADFQGLTGLEAKGFRLAVNGDLSGNWLRGRVVDAEGNTFLIDFAKVINWEGWKDVEVWLPENVVYPVTLDRIYIASTTCERAIQSQINFCNLRGLFDYTSEYPTVETPESTTFRDEMQVVFYDWTGYGADITFMADATDPSNGAYYKKRADEVFLYNAAAGIYLGKYTQSYKNDHYWVLEQNKTQLVEYSPEFAVFGTGSLFVVQMTAMGADGNNGLMFADKTQWSRVKGVINSSYTNNIVVLLDVSPQEFSNKKEYSLLHGLLKDAVRSGKNIFVLSQGGTAPEVNVIDGVRYMTFGKLYDDDGNLNEAFSVLRFRVMGDDIKYSIECIIE